MTLDTTALKATWAIAAAHGTHVPAYFYGTLFRQHPETRPMFPASMAAQQDKLVGALGAVISNVDHLDAVVPVLRRLGRDHRKFGATEDLYPAVGLALLETLGYFLGDQWTPDVQETWTVAYETVASVMADAAREAEAAGIPPWWDGTVVKVRRARDHTTAAIAIPVDYPWRDGQLVTLTHRAEPGRWHTTTPIHIDPHPDDHALALLTITVAVVDGDPVTTALAVATYPGDPIRFGPPLNPHPRETTNQENPR